VAIIRRSPGRLVAATALSGAIVLAGCGGTSKNSLEARFVSVANFICRETQKPGFGPGAQARIRPVLEEFRALAAAPHKPRRVARYLSDVERLEGDDTYRLRAEIYADKKALRLTACLGPPPRNPKGTGRKPGPSGVPMLSGADVRRAISMMGESRVLARILHGVRYGIAHKGPWSGGEENRLVGAVFWLNLTYPTNIVGSLPEAAYEPNRFPPYIEQTKYFRARAVKTLRVEVDLTRGVVAGIVPR
jgi:hypothetical protein